MSSQVKIWFQTVNTGVWVGIDNTWTSAIPRFSRPTEIHTDRLGLIYRVGPTSAANRRRYPTSLELLYPDPDVMISGTLTETISAVDQGNKYFHLSSGPDYTGIFQVGLTFTVTGSTGNDGTYTIAAIFQDSGKTRITTVEAIPDGTVDGSVNLDIPLPEFIRYWGAELDSEFYVYHKEIQTSSGNVERTWRKAYRGHFDDVPGELLGTLQRFEGKDIPGNMKMVVTEHGTFDNIDNDPSASYTAVTRPF